MTFTEINVSWFIAAVVGVLLSAYLIKDAFRDLAALRLLGRDGASWTLAVATMIIETNKLIIHSAYVYVGYLSFMGPMPANRVSLAGVILVASSTIMDINSMVLIWANHRARKEIRRIRRTPVEDEARDEARDAGRDPERDLHRDEARDIEHDKVL